MTLAERFAVWLYQRPPRLRRAWKATCALWFGGVWALIAAPNAAAYTNPPSPIYQTTGRSIMEWSGLVDTYGVPVSNYYISMVSPVEMVTAEIDAANHSAASWDIGAQIAAWITGLFAGLVNAIQGFAGYFFLLPLSVLLLFFGVAGIWFVQFAISAPWLRLLASMADPVVTTLQGIIVHLYVMPLGLLIATGYGGVIALTKGRGRGLGIIAGSFVVMFAYWLFLNAPTQEVFGDNGLLGIGQYFGFMVAEGVVNNGPLVPGSPSAQLGSLISLLVTKLLREQLLLLNFGENTDLIPGCAELWNSAVMTGALPAPTHAMGQCGALAAEWHAQTLGLDTAGWCLVLILVEFVLMFCLIYVGFHVIFNGFGAFFGLLILMVEFPLGTFPGALRARAMRRVHRELSRVLIMFFSTVSLAVFALLIGGILSGGMQG